MKKKRKIKLDYKDLETIRDFGSAMIADSVKINMEKTSNNLSSQPINYTGPEIKSLLPQFGPVVGKIITAEVTTNDPDSDGLSWDDYYDLIGQETLPIISIINGMAAVHKALGVVGVVIDGTVRDIEGIRQIKLPVWGKGLVPGHGAFKLIRVNSQITVGQLLVNPSEILVADSDGCTKIPNNHNVKEIIKNASDITKKEATLHEMLKEPGFTSEKFKEWKSQIRN